MDPNEEIASKTGFVEDPDLWPQSGLPPGVERDAKKWYAHKRTYKNGRVVWEFYRRGRPLPAGQQASDPVSAKMETVDTKAEEEWKKEQEKAERERLPVGTVRNIGNVPHTITGYDEQGVPIWAPAQTTQGPAQATSSAAQAQPPKEKDENGRRYVWRPNPGGPDAGGEWVDVGPAPQKPSQAGKPYKNAQGQWVQPITDAEGNIVGTRPVPPEALPDDAEKEGEKAGQPYKNAEGQWVQPIMDATGRVIRVEPLAPGAAPAEKPAERVEKPYVTKDGRQLTEVTEINPSSGRKRTYFVDPKTGQEVTLNEGPNVKGVPPWTPDLTKPGVGLIDRARALDELHRAGKITWAERNQILAQDQQLAQTVAGEFNLGVAILREDYQNQVTQRGQDVQTANTRLSIANQHFENALGLVTKFARYLGETPGDAGKLFRSLIADQLAYATSIGGLRDYPRETLPAGLRSWAERATGGPGGPGTPPGPAGSPPAAPADALGVGAVPGFLQPGAGQPTRSLPEPAFRPHPPVEPGAPAGAPDDALRSSYLGTPEQVARSASWRAPFTLDPALFGHTPDNPLVPPDPARRRPDPAIEALFGRSLPPVPPPEADSWRQQALNRRDLLLGASVAGSSLPAFDVEPAGLDLNASMGPMLAPVLDTRIPGLTTEMDAMARFELDQEWFG